MYMEENILFILITSMLNDIDEMAWVQWNRDGDCRWVSSSRLTEWVLDWNQVLKADIELLPQIVEEL